MRTIRDTLAALAFAAGACLCTSALAIPVVHHSVADGTTLTIDGADFGGSPGRVWLAKTQLTVQTWTDTQIVANLPAGIAPGNYLMTVQTARLFPALFVANIGGAAASTADGKIIGGLSACGAPVGGSWVYIPGRSFTVKTGPSGSFEIDNVPPGTYSLNIETPGQAAMTLLDIVVTAGETRDTGTTVVSNVSNDGNNCGACGNVCTSGPNSVSSCVGGVCQGLACIAGFADCNTNQADGCEVRLASDGMNCGACGNVCAAGATCVAGQCSAGPGASCTSDAQCAPTQFCGSAGTCQVDLPLGAFCDRPAQCLSGACHSGGIPGPLVCMPPGEPLP